MSFSCVPSASGRKVALDRPRDMVLHMNMELNGYEGTSWATKQGYKRCKKLYFNFTRTPFLGSRYSSLVFKKEIINFIKLKLNIPVKQPRCYKHILMVPHGTTINKNKNGVYDLYIYLQGVHLFTCTVIYNWCALYYR